MALELATPSGFFIIFFGVAALAADFLALLSLVAEPWARWPLFPVLALVALHVFRRPLLERMRLRSPGADDVDSMVGSTAVEAGAIGPGGLAGGASRHALTS